MTEPNLYDVGFENGFKLALARIEELEAKLSKAVEALRIMRSTYPYSPPCHDWEMQVEAHKLAKSVLAELTGGKDE